MNIELPEGSLAVLDFSTGTVHIYERCFKTHMGELVDRENNMVYDSDEHAVIEYGHKPNQCQWMFT